MILDKFSKLKALILDMDGVLWRDSEPIGNLASIFQRINSLGLKFVLATNNATKNIDEYLEKLAGFGVYLDRNQVVSSSQATGAFLSRSFPHKGNIFVVGSSSLKYTLLEYGFNHVDNPMDHPVLAVVAGLDRELTYEKLAVATSLVRSGVPLIGTNPDITYPTPTGLIPGAGTIVRAIETASEKEATIIGKPRPELFLMAMETMKVSPEETMAVGDRLETDIAGAQALGCLSALVLSGTSTLEQVRQWHPQPDLIVADLETLVST
jgi:4-nitrophenyl phosphatase